MRGYAQMKIIVDTGPNLTDVFLLLVQLDTSTTTNHAIPLVPRPKTENSRQGRGLIGLGTPALTKPTRQMIRGRRNRL